MDSPGPNQLPIQAGAQSPLNAMSENTALLKNMEMVKSGETPKLHKPPPGKITGKLTFAIFSAVLGMFQFGYNTVVINSPQKIIEEFYNQTYIGRTGHNIPPDILTLLWAITVAIFAIGGMLGGLLGSWWAEKFGRRGGMLINTGFGIVAAILMGLSKLSHSIEMVIIGRVVIGFNCGLYSSLAPLYNSEVAPFNIRGGIGTINQLAVTVGMLIAQVLGLSELLGTEDYWPILLGLTAVPMVLQIVTLPFVPESPSYLLMSEHRQEKAYTALKQLRGTDDVQSEIDEMYREKTESEVEKKMNMCEVIKADNLRKPLLVSILMHLSQQLSGILCILYYSTSLFISIGLTQSEATYANLSVGGIMVVMTFITIPLMDTLGRKTLHLTGLSGMFIISIVFTISFHFAAQTEKVGLQYFTIICALCIVVFFAIGPGSIPWMIVPELFSQGPRSAAVSIGVMVNWTANFTVGLVFLPMQTALQELVFVPFTVLLLFFIISLYIMLPETKGKTTQEITAMFAKQGTMEAKHGQSGNYTVDGHDGVYRPTGDT